MRRPGSLAAGVLLVLVIPLTVAALGLLFVSPADATSAATATCTVVTRLGDGVRLEVRHVDAAGTRFAWAQSGAGSPLLLLNGTGSPMAEWDPALLAALGRSRRVIVFDYPGLGRSGPAPGPIGFSSMADWTADLIGALDLGRVDVMGWSMGGFVAQQLAIRHPSTVRRLVLAATNAGGPAAVLGPAWVQEADSDPGASIASYLRTNYPPTPCAQKAGRGFVDRLTRAVNSGRYPDESVPESTYEAMVRAEDPWLASGANARDLGTISAPTMVMTGAQDVVTPPANSRMIASRIPGSSLVLAGAAGHSFLFQRPLRTARAVLQFLDSAQGSRDHHAP